MQWLSFVDIINKLIDQITSNFEDLDPDLIQEASMLYDNDMTREGTIQLKMFSEIMFKYIKD